MNTTISGKHIVIVIEGFPVPLFKILMQHATALQTHGAHVSIISPKLFGLTKSFESIEGIAIYRHPLPFEATSAAGFLFEYAWAAVWQFFLLAKVYLHRKIDLIEGCTPPDLVFIPSLPFIALGARYVYYQLDLNPELYFSKYGRKDHFYKALLLMERLTFRCARATIAPNESFRTIALKRGGMAEDTVVVIRSGPDLKRLHLAEPDNAYKKGRRFLVGYLGVMCEQDSLDDLIRIIGLITAKRTDVHFAVIGDGPELPIIKDLASRLSVRDHITFFGMVHDARTLNTIMSTCDLCVNPDRFDEFNDKITTIKLMEYMALARPMVQFSLTEGRQTAQEASLYAQNGNLADFALKIEHLLDHPDERKQRGDYGYRRIVEVLSWEREQIKLIDLYGKLCGRSA